MKKRRVVKFLIQGIYIFCIITCCIILYNVFHNSPYNSVTFKPLEISTIFLSIFLIDLIVFILFFVSSSLTGFWFPPLEQDINPHLMLTGRSKRMQIFLVTTIVVGFVSFFGFLSSAHIILSVTDITTIFTGTNLVGELTTIVFACFAALAFKILLKINTRRALNKK